MNSRLLSLGLALVFLVSCGSQKKAARSPERKQQDSRISYYEEKYQLELSQQSNLQLYAAIEKWIGVPHKMGACEASGIDCSCLINRLCKEAYQCTIPRDTRGLFEYCSRIGKEELREGDIIFFQIKGSKPDHVGLYLSKGKFVHTSVSKGVMISDLNEPYYARAYKASGRIKC